MATFVLSIDVDWIPGSEEGLNGLLELAKRHRIPMTHFVTTGFIPSVQVLLLAALDLGHDVGTHGVAHGVSEEEDYSATDLDLIQGWIRQMTADFEGHLGSAPRFFRAPNLWVSAQTINELEASGYSHDSSVPAGRFDFGYGRQGLSLRYVGKDSRPYYPSRRNMLERSEVPRTIIEVPPSCEMIPLNMTAMRMFGNRVLRWAARRAASRNGVVVFYAHPAEFVHAERLTLSPDEPRRHRKGLGPQNFPLLERLLEDVISDGMVPAPLSAIAVQT